MMMFNIVFIDLATLVLTSFRWHLNQVLVVQSFEQKEHAHVHRGPMLIKARSLALEPLPIIKEVEPKVHKIGIQQTNLQGSSIRASSPFTKSCTLAHGMYVTEIKVDATCNVLGQR